MIKTVDLIRVVQSPAGTFGVLALMPTPFALTLERPWKDNQSSVSAIPAGTYTCKRVQSPRFGDTFQVLNVPGRSHILFHKGNTIADTEGCILIGEEFSVDGIASSSRGYTEFRTMLGLDSVFMLVIHEAVLKST